MPEPIRVELEGYLGSVGRWTQRSIAVLDGSRQRRKQLDDLVDDEKTKHFTRTSGARAGGKGAEIEYRGEWSPALNDAVDSRRLADTLEKDASRLFERLYSAGMELKREPTSGLISIRELKPEATLSALEKRLASRRRGWTAPDSR